jgi:hypothetical protein
LIGHIVYATEAGAVRLRHLVDLSDRFSREDESLELKIIVSALSTPAEELPEDLATRIQQSFTDFPERFPESKGLVSIPVEEFQSRVIDPLRERAERGRDLYNEVAKGTLPVAVLAAQAGKSVAEVWSWLRPLPTGFGSVDVEAAELDAASKAIDGAVVADSVALTTLAIFTKELRSVAVAALPDAMVPQAVLNDLLIALPVPGGEERPQLSLQYDLEADAPRAVAITQEEVNAALERAAIAHDLGQQLRAVADTADEGDGQLNRWLRSHDPRGALRTLAGTLAVAERTGATVYSDDRVVRAEARKAGSSAFGSLALFRALAIKQVLSKEDVEGARETLLQRGAQGVGLSGTELLTRIRADSFVPSSLTEASMTDASPWLNDATRLIGDVLDIFAAAYASGPDVLQRWVRLALRGMRGAWPDVPTPELAALLLRGAVQRTDDGDLTAALRKILEADAADAPPEGTS